MVTIIAVTATEIFDNVVGFRDAAGSDLEPSETAKA
jgi:hypothetical protein